MDGLYKQPSCPRWYIMDEEEGPRKREKWVRGPVPACTRVIEEYPQESVRPNQNV